MVDFKYEDAGIYTGEHLLLANKYGAKIKISGAYGLKYDGEGAGSVYVEISQPGAVGFPAQLDFILKPEQVDELITHLYNVRNSTNFGGNNEPDS